MAHALTLTRTGMTTISLSTGYNILLDYVPRSPRNGDRVITESATIQLGAASGTALQAVVASIDKFFEECRRHHKNGSNQAGYVSFQLNSDSFAWRSRILDGVLTLGDDSLRHYASTSIEVQLTWTREWFWEQNLSFMEVSSPTESATTAGVTIYNHHDSTSGHTNFVDIAGNQIDGTEPTPLVSLLEAVSTLSTRRFYVSTNSHASPSSFNKILEGEDATLSGLTGTSTANAASSGGFYRPLTWAAAVDHNAYAKWTITSAQLTYAAGNWFRVLGRLTSSAPASVYARLNVMFSTTTVFTGSEVLLESGGYLQDFGSVQLPPYAFNKAYPQMGDPADLELTLSFRCASAQTINLDFLQLSGPDGTHKFEQQGYQLEIGDWILADGREERGYIQQLGYGGDVQPIIKDYRPPAILYPGQDTRVSVLFNEANSMDIASTFTFMAGQYARRKTI